MTFSIFRYRLLRAFSPEYLLIFLYIPQWVGKIFKIYGVQVKAKCICQSIYSRVDGNYKPSQIASTVTTVHVTCTQTALHVYEKSWKVRYWFLDVKIILICQCVHLFLFALRLVASSSRSSCCHACYHAALHWMFCFFVFTETDFVAQPWTRYLLINVKASFHSPYFVD